MTSISAKFSTRLGVAGTVACGVFVLAMVPNVGLAHSGEEYVVCNLKQDGLQRLALRACGSVSCEVIMQINANTGLQATEPYSGNPWREVTVRMGPQNLPIGPDGWVHEKYLCEFGG